MEDDADLWAPQVRVRRERRACDWLPAADLLGWAKSWAGSGDRAELLLLR